MAAFQAKTSNTIPSASVTFPPPIAMKPPRSVPVPTTTLCFCERPVLNLCWLWEFVSLRGYPREGRSFCIYPSFQLNLNHHKWIRLLNYFLNVLGGKTGPENPSECQTAKCRVKQRKFEVVSSQRPAKSRYQHTVSHLPAPSLADCSRARSESSSSLSLRI